MDLDLTKLDTPPPPAFKECMKNHAANMGGHAVDGCGEYMPPPSAVATNSISLICAACGCHRNFHRRDPESSTAAITPPFLDFRRPNRTSENLLGRKRSRTKFSQEQKERMHSFSEKLGWKMHKSDEAAVAEFCRDAGVARGVFRVWMHNNKNTHTHKALGKKTSNGGAGNQESRKSDDDNGDRFRNGNGGGVPFHDSNNGSSSSA